MEEFFDYWQEMKRHRDMPVAHHDPGRSNILNFPNFNLTLESAYFYYDYANGELQALGFPGNTLRILPINRKRSQPLPWKRPNRYSKKCTEEKFNLLHLPTHPPANLRQRCPFRRWAPCCAVRCSDAVTSVAGDPAAGVGRLLNHSHGGRCVRVLDLEPMRGAARAVGSIARFDTMPSSPMAHASRNIAGPSGPSMCSLNRMPSPTPRRRRASALLRASHGHGRRSWPSSSRIGRLAAGPGAQRQPERVEVRQAARVAHRPHRRSSPNSPAATARPPQSKAPDLSSRARAA